MLKQKQFFFSTAVLILISLLAACSSQPQVQQNTPTLEATAQQSPTELELLNILQRLSNENANDFTVTLNNISQQTLNANESQLLLLVKAKQAQQLGDNATADIYLAELHQQGDAFLENKSLQIISHQLYADILESHNALQAAQLRMYIAPLMDDQQGYIANHQAIWQLLSSLNKETLEQAKANTQDNILKQWLTLSLLARHQQLALNSQIAAVDNWQKANPIHPAALIPPFEIAAIRIAAQKRPSVIAVLLPFEEKYSRYGKAIRDGLMSAFYQTNYRPKMMFYSVDANQDFNSFYNDAVSDGAELIIGPLFKPQLEQLYSNQTANNALAVPTIALNKINNNIIEANESSPQKPPNNLFEYSLSSNDEIKTLLNFTQHHELKNAIIIAQKEKWAEDDAKAFTYLFNKQGGKILSTEYFTSNKEQSKIVQKSLSIDKSKNRIKKLRWALGNNILAEPRRRQDIDSIILLAKPKQATTLRPVLSFHYVNNINLLSTSAIYRGYSDSFKDKDLNGIIFTDLPLIINPSHEISENYQNSTMIRMYGFGIDAFQLAERLALMQQLPELDLNGATGKLHLNGQNIERRLALAQFKRGRVEALPDSLLEPKTAITKADTNKPAVQPKH